MDARLTPHRSLSLTAFNLLIGVFVVINCALSAFFLWRGAWPVLVFQVLDVVLIALAFRLNYAAARAQERVLVAADRVQITRRNARGQGDQWMASPLWAQARSAPRGVAVAVGGRAVEVGAFLSPAERDSFAAALNEALRRARREGFNPTA